MCTVRSVEEGARELKLVIYDWNLTQEYDLIGQVMPPLIHRKTANFGVTSYQVRVNSIIMPSTTRLDAIFLNLQVLFSARSSSPWRTSFPILPLMSGTR
jgi:hypothetical protein